MLLTLRRHPWVAGAFVLATAAMLWFLVDVLDGVTRWSAPEAEPVQPWMTVGYIGRTRDLDPRLIDEVAGLPLPENGRPLTLTEVARQRGVPVAEVIAQVEAALAELQPREGGHDGGRPDGRPEERPGGAPDEGANSP